MEYEIRFAQKNDIYHIMRFIDDHWQKGHILAQNRELFEWQYLGINKVNMVLGFKDGLLRGVLGFIIYDESEEKDIALALWKSVQGEQLLGIRLLHFLMNNEPHRAVVCPGINMNTTAAIYERFGFKIGKMSHWYRLRKCPEYHIAKINNDEIPVIGIGEDKIVELEDFDEFSRVFNVYGKQYCESRPFKSFSYIRKRYYNHPSYVYHLVGIKKDEKVDTVVVYRVQECDGSRVIRIVDLIGNINELRHFMSFFDSYMEKISAEYLDIYEVGLSDDTLQESGLKSVEQSGNIIPNYFAPYLSENIDIYYCISDSDMVLFRGDGDQDRPN